MILKFSLDFVSAWHLDTLNATTHPNQMNSIVFFVVSYQLLPMISEQALAISVCQQIKYYKINGHSNTWQFDIAFYPLSFDRWTDSSWPFFGNNRWNVSLSANRWRPANYIRKLFFFIVHILHTPRRTVFIYYIHFLISLLYLTISKKKSKFVTHEIFKKRKENVHNYLMTIRGELKWRIGFSELEVILEFANSLVMFVR